MTDLIIDIKTNIIQQAKKFGITKETAALIAACIDDTAKDYAGERVYIGQPLDVRARQSARDRAIKRDHAAGERIALLMRRYGLSRSRINQIIND